MKTAISSWFNRQLPRIHRWQVQRRIFRLYGDLGILESAFSRCKDPGERVQMLAQIDELERRMLELRRPKAFSEMSFNLRMHVRALRESARRVA